MNPLFKIGSSAEQLGRALVPDVRAPRSSPSPSPSPSPYFDLLGGSMRTREEAEAQAWRAYQARRDAKSTGRVVGLLLTFVAAAYFGRKKLAL